jgi:hypothetical protein
MRLVGHRRSDAKAIGALSWLLGAGDMLCFFLFAALGHNQHGETGGMGSIAAIALPFIVAWFAVAPWAGAFYFSPSVAPCDFLRRTALAWLCAWPLALLLRAAVQHRGITVSFDLIALLANGIFLLLWRGAFVRLARYARPA